MLLVNFVEQSRAGLVVQDLHCVPPVMGQVGEPGLEFVLPRQGGVSFRIFTTLAAHAFHRSGARGLMFARRLLRVKGAARTLRARRGNAARSRNGAPLQKGQCAFQKCSARPRSGTRSKNGAHDPQWLQMERAFRGKLPEWIVMLKEWMLVLW